MPPRPEIDGASIVFVGSFNPSIFQPSWLAAQNLIRATEVETADVQIISPEISHFRTHQIAIQVTTDKFQASTTDAGHWLLLRDLVWGAFSILEHTPVTALGLNRNMHFRIADGKDRWHEIGNLLASKQYWKPLLGDHPGLRSLVIEGVRPGAGSKKLVVKVEPSVKVTHGLYVSTNEQYEAPQDDGLVGLLGVLKSEWEHAQLYAQKIADQVLAVRTE